MFARQAFRSAQPLRNSVRRYATEGKPSNGPNIPALAAVAAASAAGGYFYYTQTVGESVTSSSSSITQQAVQKATGGKTLKGGDQGFVDLKLESVENVNHNTKRFRFALPEGDVSGLEIASALLTKYQGPEMEKPVVRPYTPISDEGAVGYLDLLVKKYPNGPMSEHMHEMQPNQRLLFKGPLPKYPLKPNQHNHIALIAGGTGITPMYQLMRAIFNNPEDKTKVTLVFGNVKEEDILLKREFEELENKYPQRFRAFYVLGEPSETWQGGKGFITKDLLKTVLPEPKTEGVKVFVCGPPGLYKAISGGKKSPRDQGELAGVLKELGYSKDQVFKF